RAGVLVSEIAIGCENPDVGPFPKSVLGSENAVVGCLLTRNVLEPQIFRSSNKGKIGTDDSAICFGAPVDVAEPPAMKLPVALIVELGSLKEERPPFRHKGFETRKVDHFHIRIDEREIGIVGEIDAQIAGRPPANVAAEFCARALTNLIRGNRVGDEL